MNNSKKTILILASNPKDTTPLRLDKEIREIDEGLRRAQRRDQFILQQKLAVRPADLHRALLDFDPDIVHFSGHGQGEAGIILENETGHPHLASTEALTGLFALFPKVKCVVLNACYSEVQAAAIAEHVQYVIGMSNEIDDTIALAFSVAFYDALGGGKSVEFAYKLGCSAIQFADLSKHIIPILKTRKDKANDQKEIPSEILEHSADSKPHIDSQNKEVEHASPLIFISYAKEDERSAVDLYNKLKNAGLRPWLDREDILPGEEWDLKIKQILRKSDFLLICLSSRSVIKRGYVQKELRMALDVAQEMPEGSIFLIPIRLDEVAPPYRLSAYHYVDLFKPDGFDRILRSISTEWNK